MSVEYHPDAKTEGLDAAQWYADRQQDLAVRFLKKWKEAESKIAADPERNRVIQEPYRSCQFDVFPFALIYRIDSGNCIQVIAVMHLHRAPDYWRKRG